jgi:hypothetical protein
MKWDLHLILLEWMASGDARRLLPVPVTSIQLQPEITGNIHIVLCKNIHVSIVSMGYVWALRYHIPPGSDKHGQEIVVTAHFLREA